MAPLGHKTIQFLVSPDNLITFMSLNWFDRIVRIVVVLPEFAESPPDPLLCYVKYYCTQVTCDAHRLYSRIEYSVVTRPAGRLDTSNNRDHRKPIESDSE